MARVLIDGLLARIATQTTSTAQTTSTTQTTSAASSSDCLDVGDTTGVFDARDVDAATAAVEAWERQCDRAAKLPRFDAASEERLGTLERDLSRVVRELGSSIECFGAATENIKAILDPNVADSPDERVSTTSLFVSIARSTDRSVA